MEAKVLISTLLHTVHNRVLIENTTLPVQPPETLTATLLSNYKGLLLSAAALSFQATQIAKPTEVLTLPSPSKQPVSKCNHIRHAQDEKTFH